MSRRRDGPICFAAVGDRGRQQQQKVVDLGGDGGNDKVMEATLDCGCAPGDVSSWTMVKMTGDIAVRRESFVDFASPPPIAIAPTP